LTRLHHKPASAGQVRKRFGQHFLAPAWADKVVNAIDPSRDDSFLEIGPGQGALTSRLASRVRHLTAIEIDRDLAADLRLRLPPNVEVVAGDFLDADLRPYLQAGPLRIAGNLPYNISSPILFKLLATARELAAGPERPGLPTVRTSAAQTGGADLSGPPYPLVDATVMLQLEVAERLVAQPGTKDYGVLTIFTALHADVQRLLTLPPGAFRPPPRVHSAVVRLTFRPSPLPAGSDAIFNPLVRTMFMQRRKTLLNALRPYAVSVGRDPGTVLAAAGIDPVRRPETLTQADLLRLVSVLSPSANGLKPEA
jgi:16S rRNA (adenine1518-N6/adenine1519-N6)-dimethyltransferase